MMMWGRSTVDDDHHNDSADADVCLFLELKMLFTLVVQ